LRTEDAAISDVAELVRHTTHVRWLMAALAGVPFVFARHAS
jgi:hypothetical protein